MLEVWETQPSDVKPAENVAPSLALGQCPHLRPHFPICSKSMLWGLRTQATVMSEARMQQTSWSLLGLHTMLSLFFILHLQLAWAKAVLRKESSM